MVQQLTKEELLKRVMALEDGTIIDPTLQNILMCPSNSPEMVDTLKNLGKMVTGSGKYDHRLITAHESNAIRNDLVAEYVKSRKNVTDVCVPNIGIIPNDLENPIQVDGVGWRIRIAESGGFPRECHKIQAQRGTDNESLFNRIDEWVKKEKWAHTYLYSIDDVNFLNGGFGSPSYVDRTYIIRLTGVTQEEINALKNANPKDALSIADYMQAAYVHIDY